MFSRRQHRYTYYDPSSQLTMCKFDCTVCKQYSLVFDMHSMYICPSCASKCFNNSLVDVKKKYLLELYNHSEIVSYIQWFEKDKLFEILQLLLEPMI